MRKPKNTVKNADKIKRDNVGPTPIFDTVEEAAEEAVKQAKTANVMPSSVMVSAQNGYATGDGVVHPASGVSSDSKGRPKSNVDSDTPAEGAQVVPDAPSDADKGFGDPDASEEPTKPSRGSKKN